jgi:amidase
MRDELIWLDATEQARLVRDGEVTPAELVDTAIARIERLNPTLNAVIFERFEDARKRASAATLPDGPFRGVPFLMKDLVQMVEGEPVTWGWRTLKDLDYRAPLTSYVAQKYIDSGLVTLGQTAVPEWGPNISAETDAWGVTRNPWNLDRSAGGSSTGAGAAVASGMVAIAAGNDAGGSIRIPSSFNGLVGLKASRGRTSLGPLFADFWNVAIEEGVLARSVRDVATAIDVISGNMPGDPTHAPPPARPYAREVGADPGSLRIGFVPAPPPEYDAYSADAKTALDGALRLLESLGHRVEDSHPEILDVEGTCAQWLLLMASHEAFAADWLGGLLGRSLEEKEFAPWTWGLIQRGYETGAAAYVAHMDWRNTLARGTGGWFAQGYDVLVMPTTRSTAPAIGELHLGPGESVDSMTQRIFNYIPHTMIWNATGEPAISLPLHHGSDGLPLGVMLVAPYGREDTLFRVAAQLEQAAPWTDRHPPSPRD